MNAVELLHANGIKLRSYAPGRYYATCPRCTAGRKKAHQKRKPLGVTIQDADHVIWGCNHCGWTGPELGSNPDFGRPNPPPRRSPATSKPAKPAPAPNGANGQAGVDEWHPIMPVPDNVRPTLKQLECDVLFEYPSLTGEQLLFYVRRWEAGSKGDRKQLKPLMYGTLNGKKGWHERGPHAPKPLYGLNLLTHYPVHRVILAEGENKADAINRMAKEEDLPVIGLSWMNGAPSAKHADLKPLKGRNLILWPDPDKDGRDAGNDLSKLLKPVCKTIAPVNLDGLDSKFDAAVLERNGGSLAEFLRERVKNPYPYKLSPLSELKDRYFMPLKWVVPNYIPEGCTILAGKPKVHKSFFALCTCLAAAKGQTFIEQACPRRGAWYLALEDNERRMKGRMELMHVKDWPDNVVLDYEMKPLDAGGLDELELALTDHPWIQIVFIDTLAKIQGRPLKNETPYQHDYRTVAAIAAVARRTGVAIVVVHHVRKQETNDVFDAVLGTMGLTGAADTIIVVTNVDHGKRFSVRGRDVEEIDKILDFHPDEGWSVLGDYEPNPDASNTRQRIIALLSSSKYPMSPKDIASNLGLSVVTIRKQCQRLVRDQKIKKTAHASYTY